MVLSFSLQTKEELSRITSRSRCCREAELTAFLRLENKITATEEGVVLFATPHASVARKYFALAKEFISPQIRFSPSRKKGDGGQRPPVKVMAAAAEEEIKAWIKSRLGRPGRQCCPASYLRGAFLACGSLNKPSSTHHLEYQVGELSEAKRLQAAMQHQGLYPRLSRRQRGYVLYLKDSEQIIRLLSLMGAHNAVLAYEDALVYKDMRNRINRLVNCDTANLNKTVESGLRQVENIYRLVSAVGWEGIPPALQEIAALRLQYPEASLKELGEMLTPPVGKSGVNHRFRRLEVLARQLKDRRKAGDAPVGHIPRNET